MAAPEKHPLLKTKSCTFRLPVWLLEWLQNQPRSQSATIEKALCKTHKLKAPEVNK